jgi:hypothetical protein
MPLLSSHSLDAGPSDPELAAAGIPDTSPTWELELLISGAVLFALFQIPPLLNSFFARVEPHATTATITVILLVQIYVRAIVYALIASFVVHLIARAYWVGLVGLHSVFPKGVRWEQFKSGPVTLEVYKARLASLPSLIARTDNFSSVIFSFAFLLVLLFAFSVVVVGTFSAIAYGVAHALLGGRGGDRIFITLVAIMGLVPAVTSIVDRRVGDRLGPGARGVLRRLVIIAYRGTVQGLISPIFVLLATNVGRRKMLLIFYFALFGILIVVFSERMARTDRLSVNSYDYFASSGRYAVDYRFYENQRSADDIEARLPSIQADIVSGPYVKLFIPYVPRRHNAAVAKACPTLHPVEARGLQIGADAPVPDSLAATALGCLGRIHSVSLDGTTQPQLQFRFYEHPGTGIKGVISYIPVQSLATGEHVILVSQAPTADADTNSPPPAPWVIPFWR